MYKLQMEDRQVRYSPCPTYSRCPFTPESVNKAVGKLKNDPSILTNIINPLIELPDQDHFLAKIGEHIKQPGCGEYKSIFEWVDENNSKHTAFCVIHVPLEVVSPGYANVPLTGLTRQDVSYHFGVLLGQFSTYSEVNFGVNHKDKLCPPAKKFFTDVPLEDLDQDRYKEGFEFGRGWDPKKQKPEEGTKIVNPALVFQLMGTLNAGQRGTIPTNRLFS